MTFISRYQSYISPAAIYVGYKGDVDLRIVPYTVQCSTAVHPYSRMNDLELVTVDQLSIVDVKIWCQFLSRSVTFQWHTLQ